MTDFSSFRTSSHIPSARRWRILVGVFACVLASFGVWATAVEWLRVDGPISTIRAERRGDDTERARLVAALGMVRGELWSAYASALLRPARPGPTMSAWREEARRAGETAAGLAPLDSQAWLSLSELSADDGTSEAVLAGLLNMSFLTGPHALDLIPRRVALVARSPARSDKDILALAVRDLRTLARQPGGKMQLEALWRTLSPDAQGVLAALLHDVDATLLQRLRDIR
jgi:hypothetical protein